MILLLTVLLIRPAYAMEFTAPAVPEKAEEYMPADTQSFGEGLWYVIKAGISKLQPDLAAAAEVCMGLIGIVLLVSIVQNFNGSPQRITELVAVLVIAALLLKSSNTLIRLGMQTVSELSEYGKLLLPVMAAAMAAQGGVATSTALYTGTAFFNAVLATAVSKLIVPMLYCYLCLCIANNTVGEEILKNLRSFVKWLMTWSLKIVLYVFTGYMGVTGVVSGTADAAAVKATKLTISGVVPVVGGIIADASEAILVSAGVMKSAAGIYGILATAAIFAGPFLKIGVQYMLLKITAVVCAAFGCKRPAEMIRDFSGVMGFLLAMIGTVCLLLLISTVCFMKEIG